MKGIITWTAIFWVLTVKHASCQSCSPGAQLVEGECLLCVAGKYKVEMGDVECTSCVTGQYSTTVGATSDTCQTCTADSNSLEASDEQIDCTCNNGYTGGNGGPCEACVAGKYKVQNGDVECTSCMAGQYSTTVGAMSDVCQTCVADSNSVEASDEQTDCMCNSGYTGGNGGPCVACIAGKYKVQNGDAACINCVAGQYSTTVGATSDTCQTCVADSNSVEASDEQTDCTCNSGYTGSNGGLCVACIAGKYKVATGNAACTNCDAAKYSTAVGATSNICQACAINSYSVSASDEQTDCTCNEGFSGANGETCSLCAAGTYKKDIGDACHTCRSDSNSPAGSAFCTCNAGLAETYDDTCVSCAAGKYRPGSFITNWARSCGANMQGACPAQQSSTGWSGGASRAVDGNTNGRYFANSCTHTGGGFNWWTVTLGETPIRITGFHIFARHDEAWDRTQNFAIYIGNDTSSSGRFANNQVCVENQDHLPRYNGAQISCMQPIIGRIVIFYVPRSTSYSLCEVFVWSSDCSSCPPNSNSAPASDALVDCKCNPGSTGQDGQNCVLCSTGTYKTEPGSASCSPCPAGTYSDEVGSFSCVACSEESNSPEGSDSVTSCICNAGYTGSDGATCIACEAGKYKIAVGSATCSSCDVGQYSTTIAATSNTCLACRSNSNSSLASPLSQDCTCNAGWSGSNGATCNQCAAGKYKIVTGDMACTNCVAGQYSVELGATSDVCQMCKANSDSVEASDEQTDCICNIGYTGANGGPCEACGVGKYKVTTGDVACTSCLSGQYSIAFGATSDVCQMCTANSDSVEASDEQTDCICNMGYTGANGGPCEVCVVGKYKVTTGDVACTSCLSGQYSTAFGATSDVCQMCTANSDSVEASDEQTDCICNMGYTGANGGPCEACGVGKYKVTTGDVACTSCLSGQYSTAFGATSDVCQMCTANSDSVEASDEQTDCICNMGYTGANGGPCIQCASGKYWISNSVEDSTVARRD